VVRLLNKHEAIQLVLEHFPQAFIVSTCGHISRDLYNIKDRTQNFYMVGSMGMAAPVALGLSLVQPNKPFIILDGDGSLLMNLGIMSMIGQQCPKNLIHIVLDNGMHESTGGQKTVPLTNIKDIATKIGYRLAIEVNSSKNWPLNISTEGPTLIHIKIDPRSEKIGKRVEWTPQEIVKRFSTNLQERKELLI
jgi:sulfopyruvate decarboxylase subunit beta